MNCQYRHCTVLAQVLPMVVQANYPRNGCIRSFSNVQPKDRPDSPGCRHPGMILTRGPLQQPTRDAYVDRGGGQLPGYHPPGLLGTGKSLQICRREENQHQPLGNSIVVLDDVGSKDRSEDAKYLGLVLCYPDDVCGTRCYITQIQGLAVCLQRDSKKLEPLTWKTGFPLDLVAQQAQLGHTHITTNLKVHDRFVLIQQDLCMVERQVLENALNTGW